MIIPYGDEQTWDLICSGKTAGVFQLESYGMQKLATRIKPRNTWDLAALVALFRPGPLKSGFADLYAEYKNGTKEIESFGHPDIDATLKSTYNLVVYQEALILLGQRVAWKHLPHKDRLNLADDLRKAVGKKNQQKILEIGQKFVDGCLLNGISPETANKLFEVIKNCGRYAFNLSHAWKYADIGYKMAYLKCHHPLIFYTTSLSYSGEKLDEYEEIAKLIEDGKERGINFIGPNINKKNVEFQIENSDTIRYGLRHIKYYMGTLTDKLENLPIIDDWRKLLILCFTDTFGIKLRSNSAIALINCGAFQDVGLSRKSLLSLHNCFTELTEKEKSKIVDKLHECPNIADLPNLILNSTSNKNRLKIVEGLIQFLKLDAYDHPSWVEEIEKQYMGIGLTASCLDNKYTDGFNTVSDCLGTFGDYQKRKVAVIIDEVKETVTKKGNNPGQKMAKIFTHDQSGRLDHLPIFPDLYTECSDLLIQNNTVLLDIYYKNKGWIVNKVCQI
jgi:DNA polymerase-3 subunit alpha